MASPESLTIAKLGFGQDVRELGVDYDPSICLLILKDDVRHHDRKMHEDAW